MPICRNILDVNAVAAVVISVCSQPDWQMRHPASREKQFWAWGQESFQKSVLKGMRIKVKRKDATSVLKLGKHEHPVGILFEQTIQYY